MAGDQLDTPHVIGGADQQGRAEAKVIHEALCLKDFDVGVFNKPVFLVRWFGTAIGFFKSRRSSLPSGPRK